MNEKMTESGTTVDQKVSEASIVKWCIDYISHVLDIPASEITADSEFDRFGLDSAITTAMIIDLEEWLGVDVSPSILFEQTTIQKIAAEISKGLS